MIVMLRVFVSSSALAALLAACAQTGATPASYALARLPQPFASPAVQLHRTAHRLHGWLGKGYTETNRLVYAGDGDDVVIFPEKPHNPSPLGEITDGVSSAYGLWVDRDGNLYVANDGNNSVTAYRKGATSPFRTYTKDLARPLYPIVDGAGHLWVGNASGGTIVEFGMHGTDLKQTLQSDGSEVDGMDFDSKGDLYVAYRNGSNGGIEEFPAGKSHGKDLGIALNSPQGLVVTQSGTILVVETNGTNRIDVFPPGYTQPTVEVHVKDTPTQLAISSTEHNLFVSNLDANIYLSPYPLLNPNGSPNVLHEKIDVGPYGNGVLQGMALSYGQVF